jgi:hypothetical protein
MAARRKATDEAQRLTGRRRDTGRNRRAGAGGQGRRAGAGGPAEGSAGPATLGAVRPVLTLRWVGVHLLVAVVVTCFLLLGWWQVSRARGGNALSYGYAVEWPAFAAFVVYVWQKEIRAALRASRAVELGELESAATGAAARRVVRSAVPQRSAAAYDDSGDEALAAYNRYLAWLNANPHASPSQYPG